MPPVRFSNDWNPTDSVGFSAKRLQIREILRNNLQAHAYSRMAVTNSSISSYSNWIVPSRSLDSNEPNGKPIPVIQ